MQSPTALPIEGGPVSRWPGAQNRGGQNGEKPADSSHWLSLTAIPGEDRQSKQAQLALSPNPCPRPVLRPARFALPGPLRRPADRNSPGRIANPSSNRLATGMFPSADLLNGLARFGEGEPPCEPVVGMARAEPRLPGITKPHLAPARHRREHFDLRGWLVFQVGLDRDDGVIGASRLRHFQLEIHGMIGKGAGV